MKFLNNKHFNIKNKLEEKSLDLKINLNEKNYNYENDKKNIDIIDEIITDINKIKELALEDLNKVNSGMFGSINDYKENLFNLKKYVELLEESNCMELYIKSKTMLEQISNELLKRYLDCIIQEQLQDDGQNIDNIDIIYLIKKIKINLLKVNTDSKLKGYKWLEDIYNKCYKIKKIDGIKLFIDEVEIDSIKNNLSAASYELQQIEYEKERLKLNKQYYSKMADKKILVEKGNIR